MTTRTFETTHTKTTTNGLTLPRILRRIGRGLFGLLVTLVTLLTTLLANPQIKQQASRSE